MKGGIDNLERSDVLIACDLVGEGSIDDNTVDVDGLACGEGNLGEFGVFVELSLGFNGDFGGGA